MHREILSAKFLKVCEDLQHYRGTIYQIILDTFKLGGSDFVVSLFILFLLVKEFVFLNFYNLFAYVLEVMSAKSLQRKKKLK